MEKPTPAALDAFEAAFPDDPTAARRKMFGMPAGFANGNMFFGEFYDGVVQRLPQHRREALLESEGVSPFEPMQNRPWKAYVHVSAVRWARRAELTGWVREALEHTAQMPPKKKT